MAQSGNRLFHRGGHNDKNKLSGIGIHPFIKTPLIGAKAPVALTLSKKIATDVINNVKIQS